MQITAKIELLGNIFQICTTRFFLKAAEHMARVFAQSLEWLRISCHDEGEKWKFIAKPNEDSRVSFLSIRRKATFQWICFQLRTVRLALSSSFLAIWSLENSWASGFSRLVLGQELTQKLVYENFFADTKALNCWFIAVRSDDNEEYFFSGTRPATDRISNDFLLRRRVDKRHRKELL